MPETIEINYRNPPHGQVGMRPRKIALNDMFRFTCKEPGVLTVEFIDESPLGNDAKTIGAEEDFSAAKPGRYRFKCTLEHLGKKITIGDPDDPLSEPGGELEVLPG